MGKRGEDGEEREGEGRGGENEGKRGKDEEELRENGQGTSLLV